MATDSKALAICDVCGFRYPHRVMKLNSFGLLVLKSYSPIFNILANLAWWYASS